MTISWRGLSSLDLLTLEFDIHPVDEDSFVFHEWSAKDLSYYWPVLENNDIMY